MDIAALVTWVLYVLGVEDAFLRWIALVLLVVVAALGFTMSRAGSLIAATGRGPRTPAPG